MLVFGEVENVRTVCQVCEQNGVSAAKIKSRERMLSYEAMENKGMRHVFFSHGGQ